MSDENQSNSDAVKHRIAKARRDIQADKGIAERRYAAILRAEVEKREAYSRIRANQALIIELGGKVRS